ncbi:MAG: alpha/beta hydrolase [Chitinophagaceae bacterium]
MGTAKELLYNGKTLKYTVRGQGTAVVLVHGFGEDGSIWEGQANLLPDYKVIIPHLPGSGGSDLLPHTTMESLAAALKEIVGAETATGEKVILFGHSMGGYVTLSFAAAYPQLLSAFGLVHSSAAPDSTEKLETRKKGIEFIRSNGGYAFLKTTLPSLYAPSSKLGHPEWIEQQIAGARRFRDEALIVYYRAMMERPDRSDLLKTTNMPVLFLMGRHDNAIPIDDILPQSHLPGLSYIHILEQTGHMGMIEEVEETHRVLKEFISFANGNRP